MQKGRDINAMWYTAAPGGLKVKAKTAFAGSAIFYSVAPTSSGCGSKFGKLDKSQPLPSPPLLENQVTCV